MGGQNYADDEGFDAIGTLRWFGASWGAPMCEDATHIEAPTDTTCAICSTLIAPADQGVRIPHLGDAGIQPRHGDQVYAWYHLNCFLSSIGLPIEASITCPVCGIASYNPNDINHGYCGNCHAFTSRLGGPDVRP